MSDNKNTRRNVLKTIGAASAGVVLTSTTAGATGGTNGPVSEKTAHSIAEDAVSYLGTLDEYEQWESEGVQKPELFYAKVKDGSSVQYKPRAWVFPIEKKGGEDVGYITISAVQTESPVLTYGANTAPHRNVQVAKQNASSAGHTLTDRHLYHGGLDFGVETSSKSVANFRKPVVKKLPAVDSLDELTPVEAIEAGGGPKDKQDSQVDWTGGTDDEVSPDPPNWTEEDGGGENNTDFGSGPDSWQEWDGCIPIAASMVLGHHEGIDESDDDEREALIDRLHETMETGEGGNQPGYTSWSDIPSGIEDYSQGDNSYNANNSDSGMKGRVKNQTSNNNPTILNMENGPYTDKGGGHSVCVVGYREESCGLFCSDFYHKVHDGYNDNPDQVLHKAWSNATVTKVTIDDGGGGGWWPFA